jgi:hypothetical protein
MAQGLMPVILIGAIAFGALRLLAGKRSVAPAVASRPTADQAVGRSVRRSPRSARPARPVTVATKDVRSVTPEKTYLLGNPRTGGPSDATAELFGMMSGPGLCTPRTEGPS